MTTRIGDIVDRITNTNWEFAEADTQYLTHNIHRYSGKFIPQIAHEVIEILSDPKDVVFDPYAGSGTTLLEAMLMGRNVIGIDLNPLAILIARVKTMRVSQTALDIIEKDVIPFIGSLRSGDQITLFDMPYDGAEVGVENSKNRWRQSDEWHVKWFQPHVLKQLIQMYDMIESITDEQAKEISTVAFSDVLRRSSNASSKYPNVMYDKNSKYKSLPAPFFLENLRGITDGLKELSGKILDDINVDIRLCNNLHTELGDASVDTIITHPPYIAAIPYAEYGLLSLHWLGHDERALDKELTGGRRHSKKVVDFFAEDYKAFFVECYRVIKPGKFAFIMVGNPTSNGDVVELNVMTTDLAKEAGFEHITTAVRKGMNRRGNNMGEEYLIFLRKPTYRSSEAINLGGGDRNRA